MASLNCKLVYLPSRDLEDTIHWCLVYSCDKERVESIAIQAKDWPALRAAQPFEPSRYLEVNRVVLAQRLAFARVLSRLHFLVGRNHIENDASRDLASDKSEDVHFMYGMFMGTNLAWADQVSAYCLDRLSRSDKTVLPIYGTVDYDKAPSSTRGLLSDSVRLAEIPTKGIQ